MEPKFRFSISAKTESEAVNQLRTLGIQHDKLKTLWSSGRLLVTISNPTDLESMNALKLYGGKFI